MFDSEYKIVSDYYNLIKLQEHSGLFELHETYPI